MARVFNNNAANFIEIADGPAVDITGSTFSWHAWMKFNSVAVQQRLISKWNNTTIMQYLVYLTSSKMNMQTSDGVNVQGATVIAANAWHAHGGRKNGTGASSLALFLNGALDGTAASTGAISNSAETFRLGRGNNVAEQMNGEMADIALWDVALSDAEFAALGKGICPLRIRRNHLKLYLPLYGAAFPEADLAGSRSNGVQNGTVAAATSHPPVGRLAP